MGEREKGEGMSEILTAAQVADFWYPEDSIGDLKASHEALRANYDALLQGATAQRVATLMDDADRAQVEIERLKEDNWRLEKERNIAQVLRNDTWVELAALRARIAELEKERDAARISPLTDEDNDCHIDWWTAEMENLKNVAADWKGAVAGLNKSIEEWKASYTRVCAERDAAIAERDGEKLGGQILAGALEQAVQNGKRCADERDGLRMAIAPFTDKASFFPAVHPSSLVSICIAKRHLMAADAALAAVPAPPPAITEGEQKA